MRVPAPVVRIVNAWIKGGRQPQPPIPWPRDRWKESFPQHSELLDGLPDALDRSTVARRGCLAAHAKRDAEIAFIVTMAWGFGRVGYGPWRTRRILEATPNAAVLLRDIARELRAHGPVAAYEAMTSRARLTWLGPAFGTKYLHFCSSETSPPAAIVLDQRVADWLSRSTRLSVDARRWSVSIYAKYFDRLALWSEALDVTPSDLECCIFQAEANLRSRSQWAK